MEVGRPWPHYRSKTTSPHRESNPPKPSSPPLAASSSSRANVSPPRALIFMVHGHGNDISWTFQATAVFLARHDFACFALDLESHGLRAFIPDVDLVVGDCRFFSFVKNSTPEFQTLPSFLYCESMGGAICLLIHFAFDGAVLVAPMCRISDDVKPKWPIFLSTLAIVPTGDLMVKSVKVEEKKVIADMNPSRYSVLELLRVTME